MDEPGRDERLREAAANRGLKLVKSRIRTPGKGDYGRYGLTDADGSKLLGFGRSGLTATAEEIEAYLHKGALADWKTSLRAAGARPPPRPGKRPVAEPEPRAKPAAEAEPEPEPEPEPPPPLSVRPARPADAEAIAALVAALGFEAGPNEVKARLAALKKARETPLVAEQGEVIGVLAWHVTPVLHRPQPVGRITMMVVAEGERRRGAGRALVEAAYDQLRGKGCGLIEVTSNVDLSGAHGFYRRLGFERTSYRFAKPL
ncbi:MAG TPA: GNAT family N-acetyltransferase [Allosphingosinicella sp.]|jgi:ribosomal protein S18 acetylase RimI-like enzyme|nr:GNAT family N-acetyltransferase [Allosphingosinicella sp.]